MASPTTTNFTTSNPPVPRDCPASIAPQPIETPTHGPGGVFTIRSSVHISAPPDAAFAVLRDFTTWPEWNRFVRKVTINNNPDDHPDAAAAATATATATATIEKGTAMTFDVHMDPTDPTGSPGRSDMLVTVLEPYESGGGQGWRIAWKPTSYPSWVLRTERVQEFVDDGHGETEYTCWETMYGPLAHVVRLAVGGKLERAFRCWGEDLKRRAEESVGR